MRAPRPALPRVLMSRLETGRVVVYSLLAGVVTGALACGLRLALNLLEPLWGQVLGYSPPGTPGEGGLMMSFGDVEPLGLVLLALLAGALAALTPRAEQDGLEQAVAAYHRQGPPVELPRAWLALLRQGLAGVSGLLVGRDAAFAALGSVAARLLWRLGRLNPAEAQAIALSCVAAGLGVVLHAPLAAAVLVAEVLYRRFEFEFELLLPAVLASVTAYALYGSAFGFDPLFNLNPLGPPPLASLPAYALLALIASAAAWAAVRAGQLLPLPTGLWWRLGAGLTFGLVSATAVWFVPDALSDGRGQFQLMLSGLVGEEGGLLGLLRLGLLLVAIWAGFGQGVLVMTATGGLLGGGLAQLAPGLGLDPSVGALVGAAAFLTTTHNVPVAATLLMVAWGGDALLPAVLVGSLLAHALSGELSAVPGQLSTRSASRAHGPLIQTSAGPVTSLPLAEPAAPTPSLPAEQLYRVPLPSSWAGMRADDVRWPGGVQLVGLVRGGEVHDADRQALLTGDELVVLATPEQYSALKNALSNAV